MAKPIRVALIGQKFMGRAHSNAWGQANRFFELPRAVELHTVAARNSEELDAFAKNWGWPHTTTHWQDLAADPDIDLVDIATPNNVHMEPSLAMLAAGKHVACEKPLAATLDDARAMADAARRAKGKTFVWFNYRRCPAVALAWSLLRKGALGRIYHVRARYLQSWGGPDTPLLWRFKKKHAGSGAHGDLNAHIVDMARFLLDDEISEIHGAVTRTFIKQRVLPEDAHKRRPRKGRSDVDDATLFLASFKGGAVASFEATRLAAGHLNDNGIEINGSQGSLRFDFEDMNVLWHHEEALGDQTGGWKRIVVTSGADHPYIAAWWPEGHLIGYEHGFVNMAADVVMSLSGRRPVVPLPDFGDAYQTQRVLQAALIAARERCAIKLSEVR
jgi:predicted dehydrogenase